MTTNTQINTPLPNSDGQLLIGNSSTGGTNVATITAGSNITITNGHGTITIAASGGGGSAGVNLVYYTYFGGV